MAFTLASSILFALIGAGSTLMATGSVPLTLGAYSLFGMVALVALSVLRTSSGAPPAAMPGAAPLAVA